MSTIEYGSYKDGRLSPDDNETCQLCDQELHKDEDGLYCPDCGTRFEYDLDGDLVNSDWRE